jgi:hypothetical protein
MPWNNDPTKHICHRRRGFQSNLAHHWSEFFLEISHQFHTPILLWNWILTNQQTSSWNPGSDAYFEYKSYYFKVGTLFIRNLFRARLPYLLLIRRLNIIFILIKDKERHIHTSEHKYQSIHTSKILNWIYLQKYTICFMFPILFSKLWFEWDISFRDKKKRDK